MSRHRLRPGGHHRMQVKSRGFCPGLVSRRRATGAVLGVQVGAPVVLGVAALFSAQAPIPLSGMDLTSPPSLFAPAPSTALPGLTSPSGPGASLHGTFGFPQVLASGVGAQPVDVPNLLRVASISDTSVVRLGMSATTPTYVGRHRFVGPPCHPVTPPPPVGPPVDQPAPDPDPAPGPTPTPDPPPASTETPSAPEVPPVNVPVDLPPVDVPPVPVDTVTDTTAPVADTVKDTTGDVVGTVKDTVDSVVSSPKDDSPPKDTSDSSKSDSGSSAPKSDSSSSKSDSSDSSGSGSKSDTSGESKSDTSGSDSSSSDTHTSGDSSHDSN